MVCCSHHTPSVEFFGHAGCRFCTAEIPASRDGFLRLPLPLSKKELISPSELSDQLFAAEYGARAIAGLYGIEIESNSSCKKNLGPTHTLFQRRISVGLTPQLLSSACSISCIAPSSDLFHLTRCTTADVSIFRWKTSATVPRRVIITSAR